MDREHVARDPRHGFGKDAIEVEDYVRSFDRRRPDVAVTVLRLANQVGPTVDNPLTRYFELPVCPTVLGFDPRLQFLHEEDTAEVLRRATLGPAQRGTFNVAGDGVVLLSQAIRIAGKPPLPIPEPLVNRVAELVGRTVDFSPSRSTSSSTAGWPTPPRPPPGSVSPPSGPPSRPSRTSPPPACAGWSPRSR